MKNLSLLIVTTSEPQQRMLPLLLHAIFGPIDYVCAGSLEEGLALSPERLPDLVLVDLAAGDTAGPLILAQLQKLHLEHQCLLLTDVTLWREWRGGPWGSQVLLKGFSVAQLGDALKSLLPKPVQGEAPQV